VAASQSLDSLAQDLREAVGVFKVNSAKQMEGAEV
jgi:hypothetical protein